MVAHLDGLVHLCKLLEMVRVGEQGLLLLLLLLLLLGWARQMRRLLLFALAMVQIGKIVRYRKLSSLVVSGCSLWVYCLVVRPTYHLSLVQILFKRSHVLSSVSNRFGADVNIDKIHGVS